MGSSEGVGCGFVVAYLRMMGLCAIVIAGIAYYAVCCSCPDLSFQINIPAAIAVILTLLGWWCLSLRSAYNARPPTCGRLTAKPEGPFVLFLIGFSVTSPAAVFSLRFWQTLPLMSAMLTMLRELKDKPELGLLHVEQPSLPGDVHAWLPLLSLLKRVALVLMTSTGLFDLLAGKPALIVQYWRSSEHLIKFARNPNTTHWGPWVEYQKKSKALVEYGSSTPFGVWHETYLVEPGKFEAIYNSVPEGFGAMGAFPSSIIPIKPGAAATARRRLGQ